MDFSEHEKDLKKRALNYAKDLMVHRTGHASSNMQINNNEQENKPLAADTDDPIIITRKNY
ncbi:MAG: hypothetical protein ACTSXQ_03365 [Alphaproteobacteria bacterium]